jgi:hypothetical protein
MNAAASPDRSPPPVSSLPPAERLRRAEDSVAARFTREMNATVSPYGLASDLSLAATFAALPLVMVVRQAGAGDLVSPLTAVLVAVGLVPIIGSFVMSVALRGGRQEVIRWLAEQPFAIENANTLLAGISDSFELSFATGHGPMPGQNELQKLLDAVSDDTLATYEDRENHTHEVRIGVIDSKRLPLRSNHERYVRFQRLVTEVLVPLHKKHPLVQLRMI